MAKRCKNLEIQRLRNILDEERIDNAKLKKRKRELKEKLVQKVGDEDENCGRDWQQSKGCRKRTI